MPLPLHGNALDVKNVVKIVPLLLLLPVFRYITVITTAPWPLLPWTLYCHPDACLLLLSWLLPSRCRWLVSLSLCVVAIAITISSPTLSPPFDCSFNVFILALFISLLLSLSSPVWHVCCVEKISQTCVFCDWRSSRLYRSYLFSSPRFPMFLYGLPTSRSGWPANV